MRGESSLTANSRTASEGSPASVLVTGLFMRTSQAMKKLTMREFAELQPKEQERHVLELFHKQIGKLTRCGVNPDLVSNAMFICALEFHAKENGWISSCEMVRQALDTVETQTAAHAD